MFWTGPQNQRTAGAQAQKILRLRILCSVRWVDFYKLQGFLCKRLRPKGYSQIWAIRSPLDSPDYIHPRSKQRAASTVGSNTNAPD
jgi:hypothetical protein